MGSAPPYPGEKCTAVKAQLPRQWYIAVDFCKPLVSCTCLSFAHEHYALSSFPLKYSRVRSAERVGVRSQARRWCIR